LDGGSASRKAATYTQNKFTQTSMPLLGFEPTTTALERAKTIHALDRAATVIESKKNSHSFNYACLIDPSTNYYPYKFISSSLSRFLTILSHFSLYCGIFAQSKKCGARKTAVASERLSNNIRF
jgi:hypothetical protein